MRLPSTTTQDFPEVFTMRFCEGHKAKYRRRTRGTDSLSLLVASCPSLYDTWPAVTIFQATELLQTPSLLSSMSSAMPSKPSLLLRGQRHTGKSSISSDRSDRYIATDKNLMDFEDQNQNVIPGAWGNGKVLLDVYHERARNTGTQDGRQIRIYLKGLFGAMAGQDDLVIIPTMQ
ncbi:unnamed protein product [Mytilus coruscus]|uniref:Uncharacterized protein n=1 Tax=Mytilus coruscus TaxID=42192 RepID=A0A6J8EIZ8_MYTCO|nr:unnamed protein product [Mytilus coruscus]